MEPMKPTTSETASALTTQEAAGNSGGQSHSETDSAKETDGRERFDAGASASGQRGGSLPEHPGGTGRDSSSVIASGPDETSANEEIIDPEEKWYQLDFVIGRSLRYHAKRRAFFEHCNHWTRAIAAIAGAGTVAMVIQGSHWATILAGAIVGITTALDLVFDYSKRAMVYDDLYRRFADLGIKIANVDHTEANYRQLVTERRQIEKEEPTAMLVLDAICHNEERKSRGFEDSYKIGPLQKLLCQCFDFGGENISLQGS